MRPRVRNRLEAAGIINNQLQLDYERARLLNAEHGRTYYLATRLLPSAKRPFVHALYGFARHADDIVDSVHNAMDPAERAACFKVWSQQVLDSLQTRKSDDPITRALIDTMTRWQIPPGYFADFLHSMHMDLTVTEYQTYDDLVGYMWGSAAVIALEMLPILGSVGPQVDIDELRTCAIDLGLAFQLTNFIRDVNEDLGRGRIYLPQDSLTSCGVDRERLEHARSTRKPDRPIRNLIRMETERALGLYQSAAPGINLLHPNSRDCMRTALTLYRDIITVIEDAHYDVFSGRATVPIMRRARIAVPGLVRAQLRRRPTLARLAPALAQRESLS